MGAALLNERVYVTQTEGARALGGGHLLKEKRAGEHTHGTDKPHTHALNEFAYVTQAEGARALGGGHLLQ